MATLEQVQQALIKADAAGDAEGAKILASEVRRLRSSTFKPISGNPSQPQEDVSLLDRLGNFGRSAQAAIAAPLVGAYQRAGGESAQNISDVWREDMNAKSGKPGGMGGQMIGGAAVAAPIAMIPGANTVIGGGLAGGGLGLTKPTQEGESAVGNTLEGILAGITVPAAIRGYKTVKAMAVDPFTPAGRNRIAGNVLNRMAGDDAPKVAASLSTAQGATPGFVPSVAQAARNDGISAFERTMRGINPQAFQQLDREQKGALVDALLSVAKTPEERSIAVNLRDSITKPLYAASKTTVVNTDPAFDALLQTPSMSKALSLAAETAAEKRTPFSPPVSTPAHQVPTGVLDSSGNPILTNIPYKPGQISGETAQHINMGMGDAIGSPMTGMQGELRRAAIGTKQDFNSWLENNIPGYLTANAKYSELSRPINQMDIGRELYNRFVPALADQGNLPFKTSADAYAKALLRNGDELARNTTGMKNATLEGTMTPDKLSLLRGVAKDAESKAAAEMGGKGIGSDTVQKIAMSNIAAEAGIPNWASNAMSIPGGWAKRAGDVLYGNADEQVRQRLAYLLTHPTDAAQAMNGSGATPSGLVELLKKAAMVPALAAPMGIDALPRQ